MKRIYISIGNRVEHEADSPKDIGSVIVFDYDSKQVLCTLDVIGDTKVVKGRSRGSAGIEFFEDFIYVASRQSIIAFNPSTYKEDHRIPIGGPKGFHGMRKGKDEVLWVSCHGADVKQGIKDRKVISIIPTTATGTKIDTKNGFNAIGFSPNGEEYHMYCAKECIYNFTTKTSHFVGKVCGGPHDICFINNEELLFTRSSNKELVEANLCTDNVKVVFTNKIKSVFGRFNIQGFTRGIAYHKGSNTVFVASGPGTIHELDYNTWKVKSFTQFLPKRSLVKGQPEPCPFDILLDPRDWD